MRASRKRQSKRLRRACVNRWGSHVEVAAGHGRRASVSRPGWRQGRVRDGLPALALLPNISKRRLILSMALCGVARMGGRGSVADTCEAMATMSQHCTSPTRPRRFPKSRCSIYAGTSFCCLLMAGPFPAARRCCFISELLCSKSIRPCASPPLGRQPLCYCEASVSLRQWPPQAHTHAPASI